VTIKEAIIQTLIDNKKLLSYNEIYNYIKDKQLVYFSSKTPELTVSAALTNFIQKGDNRVKRVKTEKTYLYYYSKYENEVNTILNNKEDIFNKKYSERNLHKLLSSFLNSDNIFSKTIFHESSKKLDNNQKWIHPDMVGVKFLELKSNVNSIFLKSINKQSIFKIYSYELKKEIKNDYELKQSFFQTVSNSSWANYGYLVAYDINSSLFDELQRLNESFGIGIILLSANPYRSKTIFQAKYSELDFKTIDKLCQINSDFSDFIELIEKILNADERYIDSTKKELLEFCDDIFKKDSEIEEYLKKFNIPFEKEDFNE